MTTKCFLLILLLCASVYTQETNNENVNDVESIPEDVKQQVEVEVVPAEANELPNSPISPTDASYGNYFQKIFLY